LGERFAAALSDLPFVSSVRGRGLLVGAELVPEVSAVDLARRALSEERLVINATGPSSLRMEPPLIVTEAQIDDAVARIGRLVS
jgi:acetylornithine aminotransferase/acetylornithine/N-succinyldiaminopimelate aminotransferase